MIVKRINLKSLRLIRFFQNLGLREGVLYDKEFFLSLLERSIPKIRDFNLYRAVKKIYCDILMRDDVKSVYLRIKKDDQ